MPPSLRLSARVLSWGRRVCLCLSGPAAQARAALDKTQPMNVSRPAAEPFVGCRAARVVADEKRLQAGPPTACGVWAAAPPLVRRAPEKLTPCCPSAPAFRMACSSFMRMRAACLQTAAHPQTTVSESGFARKFGPMRWRRGRTPCTTRLRRPPAAAVARMHPHSPPCPCSPAPTSSSPCPTRCWRGRRWRGRPPARLKSASARRPAEPSPQLPATHITTGGCPTWANTIA